MFSIIFIIFYSRIIFFILAQLLKVLGVSARSLIKNETNDNIVSDIWYKLIGIEQPPESCTSDPPLLMRDPCSVLLQLVLLLPNLELGEYNIPSIIN